jgi:hypothetical protein
MTSRIKSRAIRLCAVALLSGSALQTPAQAQAPAPVPAPTPTIWSFLGIPQTGKFLGDNLLNRRSNFPRAEKKPPLKKLADPENLKSENPAIKKAAEIKKEEDLAKQKIKAVKYLASIGCGCYNRDGGITDALMAAMGDCTEEVRYETIQAIASAASEENCENCKLRSCCSEEITKKLFEIAYGRDDEGCFLEPSERVREAAQEAMCICCPGAEDYFGEPEVPLDDPELNRGPRPSNPETSPSDQPGNSASSRRQGVVGPAAIRSANATAQPMAPIVSPREMELRQPVRFAAISGQAPAEEPALVPQRLPAVETAENEAPIVNRRVAPLVARQGVVYHVDPQNGLVEVRFIDGGSVTQDNRLIAFHTYLVTGRKAVAQLEVVESRDGEATLRPIGGIRTMKVAVGDEVEVRR